jgi:GH43 family beta-xylosidase
MSSEKFTYTNTADADYNAEAPDIAVVTDPSDGTQKLAIYITKALPYPGTIQVLMTSDPSQGFEDMGYLANVNGYDAHFMRHPNGNMYLLFSTFSQIQIIQLSDPWTTTGLPSAITTATLPWELVQGSLNEAPAHVISNNVVNLVYSANTYNNPTYCCGLATALTESDPMEPSSWTKYTPGPVFSSANNHFGPGSVSFFVDSQSVIWVAYGSLPSETTQNREIRAQTVSFDPQDSVTMGQPN